MADGLLLADKPAGISSHAMVARARRMLGMRRIGHAGTLDPFATGLLVLLCGRATRAQRFVMALPKTYEVIARFGATSTTGDTEGILTETGRVPSGRLVLPTGSLRQRPPAFSAVRIDGERAYVRARRGEQVELPERGVEVHEFTELWAREDRRAFRIRCSSGTYVRSLIAALGDAYCVALRRTEIGPFSVSGAWPGEGTAQPLELGEGLARFIETRQLDAADGKRAGHGVAIELPAGAPELVLLSDPQGPVALASRREDGCWKPIVGFRA